MQNIIRVSRPELTEEERERRMRQIKEAAKRLILSADLKKEVPT